jgi:hypothetical protein
LALRLELADRVQPQERNLLSGGGGRATTDAAGSEEFLFDGMTALDRTFGYLFERIDMRNK